MVRERTTVFQPMHGEISVGHEARWLTFVGVGDRKDRKGAIRSVLGITEPADLTPRLHLMAMVAGMEIPSYANHHSMLAVHRVAAPREKLWSHGSLESTTISNYLGMTPHRRAAYVCWACIDEQLRSDFRSSWYLRDQQLIGVDWCPRHGCVLQRVNASKPYDALPHQWRKEGRLSALPVHFRSLLDSGFLRRYAEIAVGLLDRTKPVLCNSLNKTLSARFNELTAETERPNSHQLMSDLLMDTADQTWLLQNFPEFANKVEGTPFHLLDSILSHKNNAARGEVYVLALCILYPSAEEAFDALSASEANQDRVSFGREDDECFFMRMLPLAVELDGDFDAIARHLQKDIGEVVGRLEQLGLPSSPQTATQACRALKRFIDGDPLRGACRAEGTHLDDLETLLRRFVSLRLR